MFDRQWIYQPYVYTGTKINFIEELLDKRGIIGGHEIERFMFPQLQKSYDPYLLTDMEKAVEAITSAVENGDKIAIFGDYDADGITSTAVLYTYLKKSMEADVVYRIPDRFTEGYGMNIKAIEELAEQGVGLIITVDNGIRGHKEIARAGELGIKVVVTDHHECPLDGILPQCEAVVDPARPDCDYPCKTLAGVGVAYKLVQALADTVGNHDEIPAYLPLVALGTIADSVPLVDENRIFASEGMKRFITGGWKGLEILLGKLNVKSSPDRPISSEAIAFSIAPKINAAGRMGDALRALKLLLAESDEEGEMYAEELISENDRRREQEAHTVTQALDPLCLVTGPEHSVQITVGENWNPGIVGIVASRLCDKFSKPAIVLAVEKGGEKITARGSCRSVGNFNMHEALEYCKDLLIKFGGHEKAAGLEIEMDMVPAFVEKINEYAAQTQFSSNIPAYKVIESILEPEDININTVGLLKAFEPYGEGNTKPCVCIKNLILEKVFLIGETKKHIRYVFSGKVGNEIKHFEAVSFNNAKYLPMLARSVQKSCSIIVSIEANEWGGTQKISLIVEDFLDANYDVDSSLKCVYNSRYITSGAFTLCRKEMATFYKVLSRWGDNFTFDNLYEAREILNSIGLGFSWYKLRRGLDIFIELGLVVRKNKTDFTIPVINEKKSLTDSELYRFLERE